MSARARQPNLRGRNALDRLLNYYRFETVLDVGAGAGQHSLLFAEAGKKVTAIDLGRSSYFNQGDLVRYQLRHRIEVIVDDFHNLYHRHGGYDVVWASHVLEHQVDPGRFLRHCRDLLSPGMLLAVTVPPRKDEIVGGHVTLWNLGLLAYHLILAGFDCRHGAFFSGGWEGYDLSAIVQRDPDPVNVSTLAFDSGDIGKLASRFPAEWAVRETFHGSSLPNVNWS